MDVVLGAYGCMRDECRFFTGGILRAGSLEVTALSRFLAKINFCAARMAHIEGRLPVLAGK
ncbi:Unknown protein sequence [Pseudomonas savastanoi pv. phaseolicola]|nr:Unknown protein sequence [Pseudomonas savastanoi pv. phaseolicola]KPB38234.1 Unknown protein sequence [Pseudomonas savastanoi pv. phaseolicola]KPB41641.1 Unknown protein sequence [Pseudomonas savastanoi pv. phaseolicola]RMV77098.1 hypothetical protein ALP07_103562 [Pseudomonas savastanoi pv. glycinea]